MPDNTEEFRVKYTLDDQYSSKVKQAKEATENLGKTIKDAQQSMSKGFGSLGKGDFGGLADSLGGVFSGLGNSVQKVLTIIPGALRGLMAPLMSVLGGFTSLAGSIGSVGAAAAGLAPIAPIVLIVGAAVIALGAAFMIVKTGVQLIGNLISSIFNALIAIAGAVIEAVMSIGKAIFEGIVSTLKEAMSIMQSLVEKFIGFMQQSIAAATKVETLTLTFQRLGYSSQEAEAKMKWIQNFALQSKGEFQDLASVGTILEAAGLRMERMLPIIDSITSAFGASRENIEQVAMALIRISSGNYGDALLTLTKFGISVSDLSRAGLRQKGQGQWDAQPLEMLAAIASIAKKKFGEAGEGAESLEVKISNLKDAWFKMVASFGQALLPVIKSVLDPIINVMNFLSGDVMASIGKKFAAAFSGIFGSMGGSDTIVKIAMILVAAFEQLPTLLAKGWKTLTEFLIYASTNFNELFNNIGRAITVLVNQAAALIVALVNHIKSSIAQIFINYAKGFKTMGEGLRLVPGMQGFSLALLGIATGLATLGVVGKSKMTDVPPLGTSDKLVWKDIDVVGKFNDMTNKIPAAVKDAFGNIINRAGQLTEEYEKWKKKGGGERVDDKGEMFRAGQEPVTNLKSIAQSSAQTAANTKQMNADYKEYVLGGGNRLKNAISPVNWNRSGIQTAGNGSGFKLEPQKYANSLHSAITEIATGLLNDAIIKGAV